jgi:hypothetical protein
MDTTQTRTLNGQDFQSFAVAPQLLKHGKTSRRLARTEYLNSGCKLSQRVENGVDKLTIGAQREGVSNQSQPALTDT